MSDRLRTISAGPALWAFLPALVLLYVWLTPAVADEETAAGEQAVFEMREVSVLDADQNSDLRRLVRGQSAECKTEPDDDVKTYPKLRSKRPLYGTVTFDRNYYDPDSGIEFRFVVDESGDAQTGGKAQSGDANTGESTSLLAKLSAALTRTEENPQQQGTESTAATYDRLYFDLNRDLDLTNDPVLTPMKGPPSAAIPSYSAKQKVVFDCLAVELDYGQEIGVRPCRIIPRLVVNEYKDQEYAYMYFLATVAREGEIRIGTREYDAILGQPYSISGRFDRPYTALYLTPVGAPGRREYWWGSDELCALRQADDRFYTVSATPSGDKLIVKPYQGEFGVFEIGLGGRDIEEFSVSGSLRSENMAVPVGTSSDKSPSLEKVRECRLPVGDYLPSLVSIEYGPLRISVSNNYHSDGQPRDSERQRVFGIKIRKDEPFVLDFSNKPEVMFASPAKDQTFKLEDEILVKAVLTDPALDIMIRGLDDTTRKEEKTYTLSDGKTHSYERPLSLDPTVTITNSSGEQVAEGKMPFG